MIKNEKRGQIEKGEQNEAGSTYHQVLLMPSQAWPNDSSAF